MGKQRKARVLFLCVQNAARSQMAEAFLRHLAGDRFEAFSAGLRPTRIHPMTVKVMNEIGIDVTEQRAKPVRTFLGKVAFQYAISLCEASEVDCPRLFPSATKVLQWPFEDPAVGHASEMEQAERYRKVRDEVRNRIEQWIEDR